MPKAAAGKKYYAVAVGRQVGVFETWPSCLASVEKYPGARHKSFSSRAEADAFVRHPVYGGAKAGRHAASTAAPAAARIGDSAGRRISTGATSIASGSSTAKANTKAKPAPKGAASPNRGELCSSAGRVGTTRESLAAAAAAASSFGSELDLVMYADGSSLSNGRSEARAGYGVYIVPNASLERLHAHYITTFGRGAAAPYATLTGAIARRLPAGTNQTNNRGELSAIVACLARACELDGLLAAQGVRCMLSIRTDSSYSLNALLTWSKAWERNDWRTKTGKAENVDLIKRALALLRHREDNGHATFLLKVKGHSGDAGNDEADRLANEGAAMPAPTDDGLEPYERKLLGSIKSRFF